MEGMPKFGQNRYDLEAVFPWLIDRIVAQRLPNSADDTRLLKAQADEREEKAKLVALERRQREGELLDAEEVQRGRIERIIAVKTALRNLGSVLAGQVVGVDDPARIKQIVNAEVRQCLLRFAGAEELEQCSQTKG